jgi:hypothetical protein
LPSSIQKLRRLSRTMRRSGSFHKKFCLRALPPTPDPAAIWDCCLVRRNSPSGKANAGGLFFLGEVLVNFLPTRPGRELHQSPSGCRFRRQRT